MAWSIEWTTTAERDLARLEHAVAKRIVAKLEQAAKDPPRSFSRLTGADESKLRVGENRVIVLLSHEARTVLILRVDHRSRVHRR